MSMTYGATWLGKMAVSTRRVSGLCASGINIPTPGCTSARFSLISRCTHRDLGASWTTEPFFI
jgi:hypothetical protein